MFLVVITGSSGVWIITSRRETSHLPMLPKSALIANKVAFVYAVAASAMLRVEMIDIVVTEMINAF